MKNLNYAVLGICAILVVSCGQAGKQTADIRRQLEDSIKNAHLHTVDSLNKIQTQEKRDDSLIAMAVQATKADLGAAQAFQTKIGKTRMLYYGLSAQLKNTVASLAVANDRMARIKGWHFGRSVAQREQEIRSQAITIQYINDRIKLLRQNMLTAKAKLLKMDPSFKENES